MNQIQTVNGNVRKLEKYYLTFCTMNINKTNGYTHLGYPFTTGSEIGEINNFNNFQALYHQIEKINSGRLVVMDQPTLLWMFDFIICAFTNKTHTQFSKFLFQRGLQHGPENAVYYLRIIKILIKTRYKIFAKMLTALDSSEPRQFNS